jgi:hypothetical protein
VQPFLKNLSAVAICPGPNIVYFSKVVSLQQMSSHIYGKTNIITDNSRPHVFINELFIYIHYLGVQATEAGLVIDQKKQKYLLSFYHQLLSGIDYYRKIAQPCNGFSEKDSQDFNRHLDSACSELDILFKERLMKIACI